MGTFHIINHYHLNIEPKCFTIMAKTVNKAGEEIFMNEGYYSDLEGALKRILLNLIKDKSKNKNIGTLEDLVYTIKESKAEIHEVCKKLGL